jgi:membrane fusion protein YbhG
MKRVIILLAALAALGAGAYYLYPRFAVPPPADNALRVSGNIEAHESLLSFKVQGRIVELPVHEGQWVEQGQVLARLDDSDYRQQVGIDEATVQVKQAELELALAGSREQEIRAAQQTLLDAQADLQQKKLDFARAQTLHKEDAVSTQARDTAETNWKRAEAVYERAQQNYDLVRAGTRKEQINIARDAVRQAQEHLGMSRIRLGYTVLRAAKAGVILVRQAELGEVVAPGTPVVTLADLGDVWLRAYISETDLGRVTWGQPVSLRTDTYPEKTYRGRVSFISSQAEFTPKSVQTEKERVTLVYRIKIDLENPKHELKPGMPADAVIETGARRQS